MDGFKHDFLAHYNSIDQNIRLFSTYYEEMLWNGLTHNLDDFSRDIFNLLAPGDLRRLERKLKKKNQTSNQELDNLFTTQ